jgi:hypothetical protein
MPPLEVMGPGGGLSMLLLLPWLSGGMLAESSLAGGNGDGGIQLQPDDGGASSSAGGGWRRCGGGSFFTALDSKLCVFIRCSLIRFYLAFFIFRYNSVSYSTFHSNQPVKVGLFLFKMLFRFSQASHSRFS